MKCFLLAAGKGTRLMPITSTIPKCLVQINKKPLLKYWFDLLDFYHIDEILINVHHKPNKVKQFISNYQGNIQIMPIMEVSLLGSLGTLIQNLDKYKNDKTLLVCYADNLTNMNINKFISFHNSHQYPVTVGLFKTKYPKQCGILELDYNSDIVSFVEKPEKPRSDLANAGIYLIDITELRKYKKTYNNVLDISYNFLPHYVNNMKGYLISEFIFDIGNIDNLKYANKYVKQHIKQFSLE